MIRGACENMLFNPVPSTLDCAEISRCDRQNANKETTMSRMKLGVAIPVLVIELFRRPGSDGQKAVGCRPCKSQGASGLLGECAADFQKTLSAKRISAIPDLGSLGA